MQTIARMLADVRGRPPQATALAYRRVESISWPHAYFRRDIGYRAVEREEEAART